MPETFASNSDRPAVLSCLAVSVAPAVYSIDQGLLGLYVGPHFATALPKAQERISPA